MVIISSFNFHYFSLQIYDNLHWSACILSHGQLFCDPMDCSPPGSSVHGIFQARILEWVAITFSWGSSQGSNPDLLHCRQSLYHLSHQGSPEGELVRQKKSWLIKNQLFKVLFFLFYESGARIRKTYHQWQLFVSSVAGIRLWVTWGWCGADSSDVLPWGSGLESACIVWCQGWGVWDPAVGPRGGRGRLQCGSTTWATSQVRCGKRERCVLLEWLRRTSLFSTQPFPLQSMRPACQWPGPVLWIRGQRRAPVLCTRHQAFMQVTPGWDDSCLPGTASKIHWESVGIQHGSPYSLS